MAYLPDLDRLLTGGSRYLDGPVAYVIEPHRVGDVVLPTGRVVGCDPLTVAGETSAFTAEVAPGTYPLVAWVAVLLENGVESQRRVAALQLVVRPGPVRWEPALRPGWETSELGDDEYFGYGVDAGLGTLADEAAVRALVDWDYDRIDDMFIPSRWPEAPVPGAVGGVVDGTTGANVLAVGSGWGDGSYPTFVGRTASGRVGSFVTDFMVVPRD